MPKAALLHLTLLDRWRQRYARYIWLPKYIDLLVALPYEMLDKLKILCADMPVGFKSHSYQRTDVRSVLSSRNPQGLAIQAQYLLLQACKRPSHTADACK